MRFLDWLFGCRHRNKTWPQTKGERTWTTCTACGKEFDFDWKEMRLKRK